jgi:hypothetical protein
MTKPKLPPEMIPVESTNLAAIGFDPAKRELWIEFKDGREFYVYTHRNIAEMWEGLREASGKGKFFQSYIKGIAPFTKVPKP